MKVSWDLSAAYPAADCHKPGMVRITKQFGEEELIYLSGGILEVQTKWCYRTR